MVEEWKWVVGHEGRYEVSNFGEIRSHVSIGYCRNGITIRKPQILKTPLGVKGYKYVQLDQKNYRVNRLVLTTFKESPPFKKAEASHIDLNRTNNRIDNLEWTTHKENKQHNAKYRLKCFFENITKI